MLHQLIRLNWSSFLARLTRFQVVLITGYILFLLVLFSNLVGSALAMVFFESTPAVHRQIPWITPEIHSLILLIFANVLWLLHFSFTSTRLLNMRENRKLLAFGYPVGRLAWHLNLIGFFHPLNLVYNLTWLIFLLTQTGRWINVPVIIGAVFLNYAIIYSIKHRFLKVVEKRFKLIVFSFLFILFGTIQALAVYSGQAGAVIGRYFENISTLNEYLFYTPGGLLFASAEEALPWTTAGIIFLFSCLLIYLIVRDHYYKTRGGLQKPVLRETGTERNRLWFFLRRWLGPHAGKQYYYMVIHPYNRLQLLTVILIPSVYIPLLLHLENETLSAILIPTLLAAIPVALLAMGMANMYGYEHREHLAHKQFPISFEQQLKERFLGLVLVPLIIFYLITTWEIIWFPSLGSVGAIYLSNTFFLLCFMLLFLWSSYYHYKRVDYSAFSFKHPVIAQKVTVLLTFLIFGLGYVVFVPLGDLQPYRLTTMGVVTAALVLYFWRNMEMLVNAFDKHILLGIWLDDS